MKLLRYGKKGKEKPGLLDNKGNIRDLSKVIDDITPNELSNNTLKKLKKLNIKKLPLVKGSPRLGIPVNGIRQYIAIGINYIDHGNEANMRIPKEPIVFIKAISCLCGPNDDILLPKNSVKSDWEIELGVVIGKKAQYVSEEDALNYVAGYCVANDLSEREFQIERGTQWAKGKSCDTFGPLGPYLVTRDEVKDPQSLDLWLSVNNEKMQSDNTKNMIFSVAKLVSYVSQFMTLLPGDVIATGTPSGVGLARKPQVFLKPGDVVTCGINGLGEQKQKVVAYTQQTTKVKKVAKTEKPKKVKKQKVAKAEKPKKVKKEKVEVAKKVDAPSEATKK